jgi:hypothetical protein
MLPRIPKEDCSVNETSTPEGSPAPEKGVADILGEAIQLYRAHAKPLLLTCALLFVPAAIINSMARAAILGPTLAIAASADPTVGGERGPPRLPPTPPRRWPAASASTCWGSSGRW